MPKFVFNLEAVLKQRRAAEQTKQLALAAIEQERIALEDLIRSKQETISRERVEMRELLGGSHGAPVNLRAVRMQTQATFSEVARTNLVALRLAGVYKRVEVARRELVEATTSRKAVERLREQQFEEWRTSINRVDAARLDELATLRAVRLENAG